LLTYRDLEEIMPELNLAVDHVAIWRCWPKTLFAFAA